MFEKKEKFNHKEPNDYCIVTLPLDWVQVKVNISIIFSSLWHTTVIILREHNHIFK